MPIYEYECRACHHRFELRQGYDADTVTECPVCDKLSHRRISAVPVIFKGSGWYVNDNKRRSSTMVGDGSGESGSKERADDGKSAKEEQKPSTDTPAAESKESATPGEKPAKENSTAKSGATES